MSPRPIPGTSSRGWRPITLITATALGVAGLAAPAHAAGTTANPSPGRTDASSPASPTASAQRQARATGKPVAIPSLTTGSRQVSADPGGGFTATLTSSPTRVYRGGRWVAIDTTLHRNHDGTISPAAVATDLVLSGGGTTPLASILANGQHMSVAWPTRLPTPTLAADTATYHAILPGTDLAVTATDTGGFREALIVKTHQAATNPALKALHLTTTGPGLALSADATGNLTARNTHGQPVFYSPAPLMWDSAATPARPSRDTAQGGSPSSPAGHQTSPAAPAPGAVSTFRTAGPGAHRAQVKNSISGGRSLTLTPDATMLDAATTALPLIVSAAWSGWTGSNPGYAEVQQGCPSSDTSFNSTTYEPNGEGVGYNGFSGCIGVEETYYQFTLPGYIYGTHINSATLKTKQIYSASNTNSAIVAAHLAAAAIGQTTDWNNRPALGPALQPQSVGPDTTTSQPSAGFSVQPAVAAAKKGAVITFALTGDESSADENYFKRFSTTPTLVVQYNNRPSVTTAYTNPGSACTQTVPPFSKIGNTAITLKAQVADLESGSAMTVHFTYSHYNGAQIGSGAAPGSYGSGGVAPFGIGTLPSGDYTWTVYADDGNDVSPTKTCHFTVDATAPMAPKPTSSVFPTSDQEPASANPDRTSGGKYDFALPPAGTGSDITSYAYAWGAEPPTVNPPQTIPAAPTSDSPTYLTLTPPGRGLNTLYVRAIDSAGNISTTSNLQDFWTQYDATGLSVPLDSDFNDDGIPDVIGVGTAANPGLWLYEGNSDHSLIPAVQLGATGTFGGTGKPTDWIGSSISHGFLDDDTAAQESGTVMNQDLLARSANGGLTIYRGTGDPGDGTTMSPGADSALAVVQSGGSNDWSKDRQIIPAGTYNSTTPPGGMWVYPNSNNTSPGADLWALQGDSLGYYAATTTTAVYSTFQVISASGWANKTIVNAGAINGLPALWARDNLSGELDLYTSTDANIAAGATASTKTVIATSGYKTGDYSTLETAGTTGPGNCPQLWGVATGTGLLTFLPCTSSAALGFPVTSTTATTGLAALDGTAATHINNGHDFNGDGRADILAQHSDGSLYLYDGIPTGAAGHQLAAGTQLWDTSWSTVRLMTTGNFTDNQDQNGDTVAIWNDGSAHLYTGDGNSHLTRATNALVGGNTWISTVQIAAGDFNGDGHTDLIAIWNDGSIHLYAGDGNGNLAGASPNMWGDDSWSSMKLLGAGDYNNDGHTDLLAEHSDGTLYLYTGDGNSHLTASTQMIGGTSWATMQGIVPGDFNGDGLVDLVGVWADGTVHLYTGTGSGTLNAAGPNMWPDNTWNTMKLIA